ncbi:hypothetical protein OsJ_14158 [Oryza sativa Japonica Group]|uniref:SCP domain-containing protein n=1 Tax=Oryza sativa subsp. japonica TaxID=39947 RepID=B9FEA0_ORYSJ|nr:hypothetical protein OsJ_14158 [Oryza sativa Japonica Group]
MSPLYCCLVAVLCLPRASASPVAAASISVSAVQTPVEPTPVQFLRVHNEARAAAYGRRHTGAEVAAFWADGRRWYDRDAGRCAAPPGRTCGAYTQVVWRATTQLGCARRTCRNGVDTVAVCDYYPPGNIVGQRPY